MFDSYTNQTILWGTFWIFHFEGNLVEVTPTLEIIDHAWLSIIMKKPNCEFSSFFNPYLD